MSAPTGNVDINSNELTNVSDPTSAQSAATKAYVDAVKTGLDVKDSVKVATTANITLSGTQTIDGVAVSADERVLVKNQSTACKTAFTTARLALGLGLVTLMQTLKSHLVRLFLLSKAQRTQTQVLCSQLTVQSPLAPPH